MWKCFMCFRIWQGIMGLSILLHLSMGAAFADQRSYVWTYEYMTMEKGKAEIEHYMTIASPDMSSVKGNTFTYQQIELEVGMTERFDVGFYHRFNQDNEGSLKYKGYKIRFRYRLSEKGENLFDPLVYVEYKGNTKFDFHEWEFKGIFSRDFNRVNISLNTVMEIEREVDEWEKFYKLTSGISYSFHKHWRMGLEIQADKSAVYWGPVLAHGNKEYWFALGSALNVGSISDDKPELQLRLIMGIGL